MRKIGVLSSICLAVSLCSAQGWEKIDTILTPDVYNHLFLRINNPTGALKIASSTVCGKSFNQLKASAKSLKPQIHNREVSGNLQRDISFVLQEPPRNNLTARIALPVTPSLPTYSATYLGDPNIPTNLLINLGEGSTNLDLSGMSISNLTIHSALSDLNLAYQSPNKSEMAQMQIHVASADVILDHLEFARAKMVNIRNDMGNTTLILGDKRFPKSHVRVMSGAGECQLIVHDRHPVKVILRNGMFSQVEIGGSFEKVASKVYVNKAYQKQEKKACTIICETELGTIKILEE
ncbi:MAG: hypothetical protein AAF694_28255 [Bacteroidota bacterium]